MMWNASINVVIKTSALTCFVLAFVSARGGFSEEIQRGESTAPSGHVVLQDIRGGSYFVEKSIKKKYDDLIVRVRLLKEKISSGNATSESALRELKTLQTDLQVLRKEMEAKKVLVAPFKMYKQTDSQVFELGAEELVVITADEITVKSWEGPGIQCVLEKIILAKEKPAPEQFEEIKVEHQLHVAPSVVGQSAKEREESERKYLASENGRKLTAEQLEKRNDLVAGIAASWAVFKEFQGKEINTLEVKGLVHSEGNRQLLIKVGSPKGNESLRSQWQRHASLTVYLPKCKKLAIRGCQVGVQIQEVSCSLLLTTAGSRDRDYNGKFEVRNVTGDVTIAQAPIRLLSGIEGNVVFLATDEFVNSGTTHSGDMRQSYSFPTQATEISNVKGNVEAWFLRTNLSLSDIQGQIDIRNEFGDTHLKLLASLSPQAHRVLSQSGNIKVSGSKSHLRSHPVYALTQCGTLQTTLSREFLEEKNFSTSQERRSWRGFFPPSKERFDFGMFERPKAAWENKKRTNGIDLISNSGNIVISDVVD